MKYMLLIYGNEANLEAARGAQPGQMMAAYGAYTEALTKAGVIVGGDRLQRASSATTVRVANGNWDLFAVTKAPRTLNGPPCPGRHF